MKRRFTLPGVSCEECGAKLALEIETRKTHLVQLNIACTQCSWMEDILDKGSKAVESGKERVRELSKEVAKSVTKLRDTLPKNRQEWGQVVTNPRHPFTATLLAGLLLILMELSGFGVFIAVTWILGNLILNPIGWILIPLVVAIAFTYRRFFRREQLETLQIKLDELEKKRDAGELSEEQYQSERAKLLSQYFE